MENRRDFLGATGAAAIAALITQAGAAATPAKSSHEVIRRQPLSAPFEGFEATMVEVVYPAGAASPHHRHPGFVLGYVLEGRFRFQVRGEPEVTLEPGDTFYEPPDALHTVSANAGKDKPARILAFMIAEKGKDVVLPA